MRLCDGSNATRESRRANRENRADATNNAIPKKIEYENCAVAGCRGVYFCRQSGFAVGAVFELVLWKILRGGILLGGDVLITAFFRQSGFVTAVEATLRCSVCWLLRSFLTAAKNTLPLPQFFCQKATAHKRKTAKIKEIPPYKLAVSRLLSALFMKFYA